MGSTQSIANLTHLAIVVRGGFPESVRPDSVEAEQFALAVIQRVESAWPSLPKAWEGFFAHLVTHLSLDVTLQSQQEALCVEDLFLAFACGMQDAAALRQFKATYDEEVRTAASRVRLPPAHVEDVRQQVWQRLFVGNEGRPKIFEYSGRGKLKSWFRVTLVRALLDDSRKDSREPISWSDEHVLGVPSPEDDPEVQYLKRLYRDEFRVAFEDAVLGLEPEDRNVLRSYYSKRMSIDEIAAAFGIHRATAARRVNRARDQLVEATRARLKARLALSQHALESVIRLIESNLHVSVHRLLE